MVDEGGGGGGGVREAVLEGAAIPVPVPVAAAAAWLFLEVLEVLGGMVAVG